MRQLALFISILFLTASVSFGQFNRISENNINEEGLKIAKEISEKIMTGLKTGNVYLLNDEEATNPMIEGLNEKTQLAVYDQISDQFGEYKNHSFVEAMKSNQEQDYTMYRFRGSFSKKKQGPEIRVVLNNENKLAGFWILPWKDEIEKGP